MNGVVQLAVSLISQIRDDELGVYRHERLCNPVAIIKQFWYIFIFLLTRTLSARNNRVE